MIGAYCGIQKLLTKQKQKIRLRGSPVYSYLKELSVHFLCFCFEIKIYPFS